MDYGVLATVYCWTQVRHPRLPYTNCTTLANTKWLLLSPQSTCIYFGNKNCVLVLLEVSGKYHIWLE